MKHILFLFILLGLASCHTTAFLTVDDAEKFELGSCYYSLKIDTASISDFEKLLVEAKLQDKAFVLEVHPPIYEEQEERHSCEDLREKLNTDGVLKLEICKPHIIFVLKHTELGRFTRIENPVGFMFCIVEFPRKWKTIKESDLIGDSLTIVSTIVKTESKITKTYRKWKPFFLKKNQLFFKESVWARPQNAIVVCDGHAQLLVMHIQQKLNELGYALSENNIMTEQTIHALLDFQKKNGLKIGALDNETLKKLGIEY